MVSAVKTVASIVPMGTTKRKTTRKEISNQQLRDALDEYRRISSKVRQQTKVDFSGLRGLGQLSEKSKKG